MTQSQKPQKRISKYQLEALFNQAPALIAVLMGRDGVVMLANAPFQQFFGNRDATSKTMRDAYPEIEGQGYFEMIERVYETSKSVSGQERLVRIDRHNNGSIEDAYVNFVFQPFTDDTGGTIGVLIYGVEVTDLVMNREKVKEQSTLLTTIMDSASMGIFLIDENLHCTFMNNSAEEMTGYTITDIAGKSLHELIHHTKTDGTPYPRNECPIDSALPSNKRVQGEEIFVHKDGSFFPVRFTASPIIKDGKPVGTVLEALNLTHEKEVQHTMEENMKKLLFMADQRNQLLKLNEAKDEFISLASHQLRTPATGVKQYIGMLIEGYAGDLTEEQCAMLKTAYESNERQLQIVNDLLKVANVDSGKVTISKNRHDVGKMICDIIDEQISSIDARQQTISFSSDVDKPIANIDADRMRMVLENLIDNASKYTPHGKHIDVRISTTEQHLIVDIIDQGVGIAKKDINKLFKKFSRVSNPLSTSVGGSGLGLYWVKKIIDLHEGKITIDSKPGQGSTFRISIPLH